MKHHNALVIIGVVRNGTDRKREHKKKDIRKWKRKAKVSTNNQTKTYILTSLALYQFNVHKAKAFKKDLTL